MSPVPRSYFDDVQIGHEVTSPAVTVTEAHVSLYRGVSGEPGGDPTLVPELLPLALSTGLGWRIPRPPLAIQAFLGLECEILRPLRVGDTVHSRSRATARRPLREGGVLIEEHQIIDQHGEVVQRARFTFLVAKRPTEEAR